MHFQDAMDLMSGRYSVNRSNPSPFQLNGFESFSVSNYYVHLIFDSILVVPLVSLTWSKWKKMQYLPVASALLIGGLTATSVTLNRGIATLLTCFLT